MTALPCQSLRTQAPPFLTILNPRLYPGAHLGLKVAAVVPATEVGLGQGDGGCTEPRLLGGSASAGSWPLTPCLRVPSGPRLQQGLTAESADRFLAVAPHLGLKGSLGQEGRGSAC